MADRLTIDYAEAGEQIRLARIAKHLSQEELAERVGLSPQYVSNIENGNTKAGLIAFLNIANGLGMSFDRLFRHTLTPSQSIINEEIARLLEDLNEYELIVISKSIAGIKEALREAESHNKK